MLLVDTSAWIELFRRPPRISFEEAVNLDDVVTCLPVIQEVLQGFRQERAYRLARDAMFALPRVESPLDIDVFEAAANLYRSARRAGVTVRSGVDCLIATCAIRNDLEVVHIDRDFDALATVSPVRVRHLGG